MKTKLACEMQGSHVRECLCQISAYPKNIEIFLSSSKRSSGGNWNQRLTYSSETYIVMTHSERLIFYYHESFIFLIYISHINKTYIILRD